MTRSPIELSARQLKIADAIYECTCRDHKFGIKISLKALKFIHIGFQITFIQGGLKQPYLAETPKGAVLENGDVVLRKVVIRCYINRFPCCTFSYL